MFKDLAANMAGCFIIGLLSSGAALKMVFPSLEAENRPVAAVSKNRAIIQQNSPLQARNTLIAEECDAAFAGRIANRILWIVDDVCKLETADGADAISRCWSLL